MSRVGKQPVTVPAGVDVSINGAQISVKGTGGTLNLTLNSLVTVVNDAGKLNFKAIWSSDFPLSVETLKPSI